MPLAICYFTFFIVYGSASPYLPVLIRNLGYSPSVIGLLLGLFEVAGIIGPFIIGYVADKAGRYRPGILLSFLLVLAALPPLVLLRNPLASALCLVVLSVGLKSFTPLLDAVATLKIGPSGNYGLLRSVGSVSFVLFTLFLQYQPWLPLDSAGRIAFWIAAPALLGLASVSLVPNAAPAGYRSKPATGAAQPARFSHFMNAPFLIGIGMIALSRVAMAPVSSFFSLYVVEELHWNAVALLWALGAIAEIPMMILSSRLIARFGSVPLMGLGIAAIALRLVFYSAMPTPAGAVLGQLLNSLTYGLFHPAAVNFIANRVPPEKRVTGMAIYLSFGIGLPTFIGSAAGGFIVEWAGYRTLFASYTVFAVAAFAVFLAKRKVLERPAGR